ncbi:MULTISPECIES: DUF6129 family protein [Thiorhodovibrio]|jgi:hypothetical protein|uniref:DUF6129 family protein n=1 Tax=Thiorhodovibrio TaxID=61593 RepID=UPI001911C5F4|nr:MULTISPECIES: DUF6129 family protein [Thiorhodovibrio]MBK5968421.1 hypothetical protein [Thiorhodovibrio winogradskyi]WPL11060.1 hypothetical protein Thiosp_00786 [Thiorhodovibrio litoralis]
MIAPERLDQIVTIVERAGLNLQTLGALREALPDIHFTHCMDDDLGNKNPVRSTEAFNLYLVEGSSGHCLQITQNADLATGVVLAEIDEPDA